MYIPLDDLYWHLADKEKPKSYVLVHGKIHTQAEGTTYDGLFYYDADIDTWLNEDLEMLTSGPMYWRVYHAD